MLDTKIEVINKIKNKENALSEIIQFTEDGNQIVNFEGNLKTIIGETGRVQLEEIAREIVMKTFLRNESSYYSTEHLHGNYRSDLIAYIEKDISNIIEVKESGDLTFEKMLKLTADSFNQIQHLYTKEIKNDCFASVVIMNIDKLSNSPELISKFHNLSPDKKKDSSDVFNKYGIYIETKRYDCMKKRFLNKVDSNLAVHADFKIKANTSFLKSKTNKIYCEISNALKLPTTSTNSYGFKNVRDIRDPNISSDKADIVLDILNTSIKAFNSKDSQIITSAGKDKDFLIAEDDSIAYMTNYEEYTHLTICTLNGAIIDGQNSIDGFRWIIETVEKVLQNFYLDDKKLIGFEKTIYENIDFNKDNMEKYLIFLKKSELGINLETTKDIDSAKERAISKNNTMQVSKAEIAISGIQIPVQMLATEFLDNFDINITYPKKEMYCVSQKIKDKTIDVETLSKYFNVASDFILKKKNKDALQLFKLAQSLSGATKPDVLKSFIDQYVSKEKEGNDASKDIDNKIKILETKEKEIISTIESLSKLISTSAEITELVDQKNNELNITKMEISRLTDKRFSLTDLSYTIRNKKELVALINRIILIEKKVYEQYERIKNEDSFKILKMFISNKEKMAHYIFVLSMIKQPDINIEVKVSEIKDLFYNLVDNIKYIQLNYAVDMTTLRNSTDDMNPCVKRDGTESILKEPRNAFFNINQS